MAENSNPLILLNGVAVGRAFKMNFIEGANTDLTIVSDGDQGTEITVASGAGGGSNPFVDIAFAGNVA